MQHLLHSIYETKQKIMYKVLKEVRPPVKLEAYGSQHPEYLHHVLNERIPGDDPFIHHQLIYLEW